MLRFLAKQIFHRIILMEVVTGHIQLNPAIKFRNISYMFLQITQAIKKSECLHEELTLETLYLFIV